MQKYYIMTNDKTTETFHSAKSSDVDDYKYLIKNIDYYELTIHSDGSLHGTLIDDTISHPLKGHETITFTIKGFKVPHKQFNPSNNLKREVLKWLNRQLEISIVEQI